MPAEQASHAAEPSLAAYWPTTQPSQRSTVAAVEYLPTAHAAQMLAPALLPVFVIEPASHAAQATSVEFTEYVPAAHAIHELAPALVPMLVRDPAKHTLQ